MWTVTSVSGRVNCVKVAGRVGARPRVWLTLEGRSKQTAYTR
jgi:uncharacterized protein affecting Mg2+/Co2+ transport